MQWRTRIWSLGCICTLQCYNKRNINPAYDLQTSMATISQHWFGYGWATNRRQASILTYWGRDKMDAISQTTFSSAFSYFPIKISLKFVPKGPINNIPALAQIMAWRRPGDKPLSEPMMVSLTTHICVTRPQWVNQWKPILVTYICVTRLLCVIDIVSERWWPFQSPVTSNCRHDLCMTSFGNHSWLWWFVFVSIIWKRES